MRRRHAADAIRSSTTTLRRLDKCGGRGPVSRGSSANTGRSGHGCRKGPGDQTRVDQFLRRLSAHSVLGPCAGVGVESVLRRSTTCIQPGNGPSRGRFVPLAAHRTATVVAVGIAYGCRPHNDDSDPPRWTARPSRLDAPRIPAPIRREPLLADPGQPHRQPENRLC